MRSMIVLETGYTHQRSSIGGCWWSCSNCIVVSGLVVSVL